MRRYLIAITIVAILSTGIAGYMIWVNRPIMSARQPEKYFDISYSFDQYPLYPNLQTYIRIKLTSKLTETTPLFEVRVVFHWSKLEDPILLAQVESAYDQGNIGPHETRVIVIPFKIWGNVTEGTYTGWIQIISRSDDFKDITVEVRKNMEVSSPVTNLLWPRSIASPFPRYKV